MVGSVVVKVDRSYHKALAQDLLIEVDTALRVAGHNRDLVDAVDRLHGCPLEIRIRHLYTYCLQLHSTHRICHMLRSSGQKLRDETY